MADPFSNPSFGVASSDNQALADAGSSLGGKLNTGASKATSEGGTKTKQFYYRYPLKRIESGSDYLSISILDYEPVGLRIASRLTQDEKTNQIKKITQTTNEKGETVLTETLATSSDVSLNLGFQSASQRLQGKNINGFIYLPIPQNIQDVTSVTWSEESLDPLSAFGLSFGADALKNPGEAVRSYLSLAGKKLGDLASNDTAQRAIIAAISGQALGTLGGNVSASGLVARATGQIFNPNTELLFNGVSLRSFSFSFNFVARSAREGQEIKQIIRTLKKSMIPTNNSNNSATSGVFIGSPKIFQLEYKKGNAPHPFLNRFQPMALTNVSINYTGSNTYATYWDGTPVHMTMQLDFQELNPIYTEDYETKDGQIGVGY